MILKYLCRETKGSSPISETGWYGQVAIVSLGPVMSYTQLQLQGSFVDILGGL